MNADRVKSAITIGVPLRVRRQVVNELASPQVALAVYKAMTAVISTTWRLHPRRRVAFYIQLVNLMEV
jgi:hypothetical protein